MTPTGVKEMIPTAVKPMSKIHANSFTAKPINKSHHGNDFFDIYFLITHITVNQLAP